MNRLALLFVFLLLAALLAGCGAQAPSPHKVNSKPVSSHSTLSRPTQPAPR